MWRELQKQKPWKLLAGKTSTSKRQHRQQPATTPAQAINQPLKHINSNQAVQSKETTMLSRTWSYSALRSLQHLPSSPAPTTSLPALANAARTYTTSSSNSSNSRNSSGYARIKPQSNPTALPRRNFHSTPSVRKGITPDSPDPAPPKVESNDNSVAGGSTRIAQPSPLTEEQYREYSESYFNELLAELERTQEEGSDVEAEYSVGFFLFFPFSPFFFSFSFKLIHFLRYKYIPHSLTFLSNHIGRRPKRNRSRNRRLRSKQTTTKQANMAQLAHLRPQAIRLGTPGRCCE